MGVIDLDVKCSRCGGNLRGQGLQGSCPRCGLHIAHTFNTALVDPDTLAIREDCTCVHCEYNLRTLPVRSVCPECGNRVIESLSAMALICADPVWLERIRDATTYILLSVALLVLLGLALLVGQLIFSGVACLATLLALVCGPLSALGLLVGIVGLCRPDPLPTLKAGRHAEGVVLSLVAGGVILLICGAAARASLHQTFLLGAGGACLVGAMLQVAVCIRRMAVRSRRRGFNGLATVWVMCAIILLVAGIAAVGLMVVTNWQMLGTRREVELCLDALAAIEIGMAVVCDLLGVASVIVCRLVVQSILRARK